MTVCTISMVDTNTKKLRIDAVRQAIRLNLISFPSQVPAFVKHDRADLHQRIVPLYFVFGWSCSRIGGRYRLPRQRIQQILNTWTNRAVQMGYLQSIPPARGVEALTIRILRRPTTRVFNKSSDVRWSLSCGAAISISSW
jgi:hypothetical protein